jgi:hypothetical protein
VEYPIVNFHKIWWLLVMSCYTHPSVACAGVRQHKHASVDVFMAASFLVLSLGHLWVSWSTVMTSLSSPVPQIFRSPLTLSNKDNTNFHFGFISLVHWFLTSVMTNCTEDLNGQIVRERIAFNLPVRRRIFYRNTSQKVAGFCCYHNSFTPQIVNNLL